MAVYGVHNSHEPVCCTLIKMEHESKSGFRKWADFGALLITLEYQVFHMISIALIDSNQINIRHKSEANHSRWYSGRKDFGNKYLKVPVCASTSFINIWFKINIEHNVVKNTIFVREFEASRGQTSMKSGKLFIIRPTCANTHVWYHGSWTVPILGVSCTCMPTLQYTCTPTHTHPISTMGNCKRTNELKEPFHSNIVWPYDMHVNWEFRNFWCKKVILVFVPTNSYFISSIIFLAWLNLCMWGNYYLYIL